MNSRKIFITRLISGWKFQYKVIKTIADWTVMLYLIIPANIIFIMMYRSWWQETPSWIVFMPLSFLFFLIFLLSWNGNIRTYVQEADKVFLVKNKRIFLGMKRWGYAYSLFVQFIHIGVAIFIFLPFLRNHYLLDWKQIILLLFYFISLKKTILLVKFHLGKIERKFVKLIVSSLVFIIILGFCQWIFILWGKGAFLSIYIFGVIMLIASILLSLMELNKISSIDHEIALSREEKMKSIDLIFSLSLEIEKPVISKRTKPLLYRRSKRIFKKRTQINGVAELFIKIFIRNFSYVGSYFQIISVTGAAMMIIPPLWIKTVIFSGFLIMMYSWLSLIWDKITTSNPLSKKYSDMPFYFSARKRTIIALFFFAIVILFVFIGCGFFLYSYFEARMGF